MIISKDLDKVYPLCARYIRNFLDDPDKFKTRYPKIWDAFIKACTVELLDNKNRPAALELAKKALTMGSGPEIVAKGHVANAGDECGLFTPGLSFYQFPEQNIVKLAHETCAAYENGTGWKVFEGTLLHELVHWVRFRNEGTANFQITNLGEVGDLFEAWAYGFSVCLIKNGRMLPIGPPGTEPKSD
jgi:hypothetical protein